MLTFEEVSREALFLEELNAIDKNSLFYMDHGTYHTNSVIMRIEDFLTQVGASNEEMNDAKIAGFLHDIGCRNGKKNHNEFSYQIAMKYFTEKRLLEEKRVQTILLAVHEHSNPKAIYSPVEAALYLADKTDYQKERVLLRGLTHPLYGISAYINTIVVKVKEKKLYLQYDIKDGKEADVIRFLHEYPKSISVPKQVAKYYQLEFVYQLNGRDMVI